MNAEQTPNLDRITIDSLLVRGILGLHAWERKSIQDIIISAVLYADLSPVGRVDTVDQGFNYSDVVRRIMVHVENSERYTIEALATDIAGLCLAQTIVTRVFVRVHKPLAERFARSIAVEVERTEPMLARNVLIGVGSNENPETNLPKAVQELQAVGQVVSSSVVFESNSIGHSGANYLNAAVSLRTCLPAAEIRRMLKAIEESLGRRKPVEHSASVLVDLDLCLVGAEVIRARDVSVPDDDILTREYLAKICAHLHPNEIHPVDGRSLSAIADSLHGRMVLKTRPDVELPFQVPYTGRDGGSCA